MPQVKFTNTYELSACLLAIGEDMRAKVLEAGVKAAVAPILAAARIYAIASEDTGALRASLTSKTGNFPETGKAYGMVGPARGKFVGNRRSKSKLGNLYAAASGTLQQPSKYAHLVEYGHIAHNGKYVPAKPFIRPAVITTQAEQEIAFYEGIAAGFEATRKKYAS
jgi:hypothetical protein